MSGARTYLDWNASAPLRPEARAAMLEAMDVAGNPSSVHAEGRAARAIVEKARGQVAALAGCEPSEVVFTSGATEAAVTGAGHPPCIGSAVDHEAVTKSIGWGADYLRLDRDGRIRFDHVESGDIQWPMAMSLHLPAANGETGVVQDLRAAVVFARSNPNADLEVHCDATQAIAKIDFAFRAWSLDSALCSAHKFGGPRGVGALIWPGSDAPNGEWMIAGGGQEQGRRSGTENVVGIAGFGAAAEAARRDLESGVWEKVESYRDMLEARLEDAAPDTMFFGREVQRLPNTSCFAVPGWKGETQVMQMDLAGFAVSAGSACSSGKVQKASRVLLAMGFDEETASSAIRVSMGPTTTEAEVIAFADAWIEIYRRRKNRAA